MKLAHFSDIHITHFPLAGEFAVKRLAAVASYTLMGRGRHFLGSHERIEALLADIDSVGVDHALCTGDLTGVSTEAEFAEVAQLWGERLEQPAKYTCIPGNHDRYVASSAGMFELAFGRLCEGANFPFIKAVDSSVSIIGLDVSRPTGLIDSSGLVGETQRAKLLELLTDSSLQSRFVVVALHYGLLRSNGQRDARKHGLRDDLELMELLDRPEVTVDLVLHGHMHRPYVVQTKRRQVINAGSATDLHLKCGYHVYDIDPAKHTVTIARREWDPASKRYLDVPASPLVQTLTTR